MKSENVTLLRPAAAVALRPALLLLLLPSTAPGQSQVWTGPDTGAWHTGANWTPAGVPGAASDVVIDGETDTARTVNLSPSAVVNRVTVSAGDILRVNGNTYLQTSAAGYTVNGLLELTGGGDSRLFIPNADTVLDGSGAVRMQPGTRIQGGGSLLLRTTVTGAGNAGWNETALTVASDGRITANITGQTFALDPRDRGTDPGLINQGLLEAANGGMLLVSGYGNGWFNNTGGMIRARDGSEVQMTDNASILGGTLTGEGTGLLRVLGSRSVYWTDLAHSGKTRVDNNSSLRCGGTITNTGDITLFSTNNGTRFQLEAPVTLSGTGRLILANHYDAAIAGPHLLTITGGQTVEGHGQAGINEAAMLLDTGSVMQANVAGAALTVDPRNRDAESLPGFINKGTLLARNGGLLQISGYGGGWFDNTAGTISALENSEVRFFTSATIVGGTLASVGTGLFSVNASNHLYWTDLTHSGKTRVENNAWLRCAGTITNTGDITLFSTGNGTRFHLQAPVTLTGNGRLILSNHTDAAIAGPHLLTITGGQTVEGYGEAGLNDAAMLLDTGSVMEANVATAPLTVDPRNRDAENLPGFINKGTLLARNTGVLLLTGYGGGWFDNTGGTIRVEDGSEVHMNSSAGILRGTLTGNGTGLFRVLNSQSVYWTDLTHSAKTVVNNNAWLRCGGTITNTGDITLFSTGNGTRFQLEGNVTLTGAGRLILSNHNDAAIAGPHLLTITGGQDVEGHGQAGLNDAAMLLDTGSVMEANVATAPLTVDPRNRDAENLPGFINKGTLLARNTGVLLLTGYGGGWFDNTGGTIRVEDGSEVHMNSSAGILRGTLTGNGTGLFRVLNSQSVYWTDLTHSAKTVVNNNAWLRCGGTITNTGDITLFSTGNGTRFQLEGNVTLTGAGRLILSNHNDAAIGGPHLLTVTGGQTVEGRGNIGLNESAFFNTAGSVVNANVPGQGLAIDPGGTKLVTNRGILRASNGGALYLSGYGGGGFDNANGIVEALDGSQVYFVSGAAISGGVFRTAGSGALVLTASQRMTFTANTTNTGLFMAENNSSVAVRSRLTNSGVMRFTGAANLTDLTLLDNTTFAGGGVIELNGNARIHGAAVLIVEDQTIRGTGNIGWNESSISIGERGLVVADVPGGTLHFDPTPIFGFTNEGTLRAENGGILNLSSYGGGDIFMGATSRVEAIEGGRVQFDNNTNLINRSGGTLTGGTWLVNGQAAATSLQLPGGNITTNAAIIELDGPQAQFAQLASLTANTGALSLRNGATLSPAGAFTNAGALDIAAASAVNAAGAVTLTSSSSLACHIGGLTAAGSLNSAGPAGQTAIAGRLTVVFDPGFTPAVGNSWPIISGPPTGTFSQVTVLGLPSSLRATLEYTPNFVTVTLSARDGIHFADWASGYDFASPADAAQGADPDADGLQNLLEFALGTHPLRFEPDAAPQPVIVTVAAQQHLGLRYWKPAGASRRLGITYTPERSPAAATWTGSDIVLHSTVPADVTGREQITVRHTAPVTARQLMRMRVSQP